LNVLEHPQPAMNAELAPIEHLCLELTIHLSNEAMVWFSF